MTLLPLFLSLLYSRYFGAAVVVDDDRSDSQQTNYPLFKAYLDLILQQQQEQPKTWNYMKYN